MVFDDALHDVETETSTLPRSLGREVRVEDLLREPVRDARAAVGNFDTHRVGVTRRANGDRAVTVGLERNSICGIVQQVGPQLMQLGAVGLDPRHGTIVITYDPG